MTADHATLVVLGGFVLILAAALGVSLRSWRAALFFLSVIAACVIFAHFATWLVALLSGGTS